jgi:hypothetical protein
VVSFAADEASDALLGVKTAEAGMAAAAAAGGGALCFHLYPSHVADGISLFDPQSNFCNIYFSVVISPNLIFFLYSFPKSPCFHYFHCLVYISFLEQCLYALSCFM